MAGIYDTLEQQPLYIAKEGMEELQKYGNFGILKEKVIVAFAQ